MIAIDSSSWIAYTSGAPGKDVEALGLALEHRQAVLPPVVLSELLSDPHLPAALAQLLRGLPLLPTQEGFWERVGFLRAKFLARGRKPALADSLIAQCCLDHDVPLITRDADFRLFVSWAGLKLFPVDAF